MSACGCSKASKSTALSGGYNPRDINRGADRTLEFLPTLMPRDFGHAGKRLNARFDFDKISLVTFFLGKKVTPHG